MWTGTGKKEGVTPPIDLRLIGKFAHHDIDFWIVLDDDDAVF
jgi:hypothetical protein